MKDEIKAITMKEYLNMQDFVNKYDLVKTRHRKLKNILNLINKI